MAQTELHADSIGDLDEGRARGIINAAIRSAASDLEDRGQDGEARKVLIEVSMKKDGENVVLISLGYQAKLPPYRTDKTAAKQMQRQTKSGPMPMLAFQEHDAENPDQGTFPTMDAREKE